MDLNGKISERENSVKRVRKKKRLFFIGSIAAIIWSTAGGLWAQEYRIGKEDVLTITFWQAPELNTRVQVDRRGYITVPVIGSIKVEGMTTTELSKRIVDEISIFNKDITQATVTVEVPESRKIYVLGSVLSPGKHTFQFIPDIWQAILEAGGISPEADLTNVQIIRGEMARKKGISNEVVDLRQALNLGRIESLPRLYPGDTIFIPSVRETAARGETQMPAAVSERFIYVFGAVVSPGPVKVEGRVDLLRALVMAGGPTPDADLEHLRIISRSEGKYPLVVTMNLRKFTSKAEIQSIAIEPGTAIYLPRTRASMISSPIVGYAFREALRVIFTSLASILILSAL